jgi:hypothetical protein
MKFNLKQLGSTPMLVLMLFVALFSSFEILVTWNSGIDKDYPGYTIGMITCLSISAVYLVWYFRKVAVQ